MKTTDSLRRVQFASYRHKIRRRGQHPGQNQQFALSIAHPLAICLSKGIVNVPSTNVPHWNLDHLSSTEVHNKRWGWILPTVILFTRNLYFIIGVKSILTQSKISQTRYIYIICIFCRPIFAQRELGLLLNGNLN